MATMLALLQAFCEFHDFMDTLQVLGAQQQSSDT